MRSPRTYFRPAVPCRQHALRLEQVNDGRRVHAARAVQILSALEDSDVFVRVHAIAAAGAARRDQSEVLPRAKLRRRNTDETGYIADAKIPVRLGASGLLAPESQI